MTESANLFDSVKVRFVMVGTLNTAFGLGVFPVLMLAFASLHQSYMLWMTLSHCLSVSFAYLTSKFITFRTRKNYLREFSRFGAFYLGNYLINLAVLPACVELLHLRPIPSQIGFSLLSMVMSYLWHSRVTFRGRGLAVGKRR